MRVERSKFCMIENWKRKVWENNREQKKKRKLIYELHVVIESGMSRKKR